MATAVDKAVIIIITPSVSAQSGMVVQDITSTPRLESIGALITAIDIVVEDISSTPVLETPAATSPLPAPKDISSTPVLETPAIVVVVVLGAVEDISSTPNLAAIGALAQHMVVSLGDISSTPVLETVSIVPVAIVSVDDISSTPVLEEPAITVNDTDFPEILRPSITFTSSQPTITFLGEAA